MKHKINTATGTCSVCGLTTVTGFTRECLGKPMHPLTMKAVRLGEVDYYDGSFHSKTEAKEEMIHDYLKGIADKHGFKLVEVHAPRIRRANNAEHLRHNPEADTRDDYVPKPIDLNAYEAMKKFINDFMAQETSHRQGAAEANKVLADVNLEAAIQFADSFTKGKAEQEYALSKDEIEFLKQIHDQPIPKRVVAMLELTKDQFIMLHTLKKVGYVYPSIDGSKSWVLTPKAEAYLESLSKPAPLVMSEQGIALLLLLSEDSIDNVEIMSAETIPDAADLLVGLKLAMDCGEHLHITTKGREHVSKLLDLTVG